MKPDLPEIISGFDIHYPNWTSGFTGSDPGISGSGFGYQVLCPGLAVHFHSDTRHSLFPDIRQNSTVCSLFVRPDEKRTTKSLLWCQGQP
jgi:hypothetical protein